MIRIAAAAVLAALLVGTSLAPAGAQTTPPASSGRAAHGKPTGHGQFATEAAARRSCPSDTVVWANTNSKTLHLSGDRYYGKTKRGAFMCERQAMQASYHIARHGAAKAKKAKANSK